MVFAVCHAPGVSEVLAKHFLIVKEITGERERGITAKMKSKLRQVTEVV